MIADSDLRRPLNTLVKADGHTPAVDGLFDEVKPLSPALRKILEDAIPKRNEATTKKALGVSRWINDEYWLIESANPKVAGMDGAAKSFVEFFYACA